MGNTCLIMHVTCLTLVGLFVSFSFLSFQKHPLRNETLCSEQVMEAKRHRKTFAGRAQQRGSGRVEV